MIPKIIHYAWVGPSMPDYAKRRVDEWQKRLPDWTFKFWNENNYDLINLSLQGKKFPIKNGGTLRMN